MTDVIIFRMSGVNEDTTQKTNVKDFTNHPFPISWFVAFLLLFTRTRSMNPWPTDPNRFQEGCSQRRYNSEK
jgi:hypothetical protein